MEIKSIASQPTDKGLDEFFTGNVRVAPLFTASHPARMSCACVTFDPAARSAWHTRCECDPNAVASLQVLVRCREARFLTIHGDDRRPTPRSGYGEQVPLSRYTLQVLAAALLKLDTGARHEFLHRA